MEKKLFTIILSLLLSSFTSTGLSDRLCAANEEIIISFKLKNSNKIVSLCQEKSGNYLVYRFGTKNKVELQFPSRLDKTSWALFNYKGYWRFGGKVNAGFGDLVLQFKNQDIYYRIFQDWNDEDGSSDFGVELESTTYKARKLMIDKSSLIGSLMKLNDLTEIKNEADSE